MSAPTRNEVEKLMKVCQVGFGGPLGLDNANDALAQCYGMLGALIAEVERLTEKPDDAKP